MQDAGSSQAEGDQRKSRYALMDKVELEALTVSAIREHRRLLEADQAVYDEWMRASEDSSIANSVLESLQEEHFARQKRAAAQQDELSDMLDALGFVPAVPVDDEAS
ncbi:transcriptional repressor TraM [Rhizobium mesoamericanum]|uniref:Putative transcriptional repressor traM n=1 Tax=Rhizobium mesoamericanum STM3625 TaxID=1211777 RepID=K0PSF3_9HYPH|nr:transcriptional repressor TraM [Rhizobium mesoamericanum]CCM79641.1 putative transcriptional repressor traM [Rhizobium mesoamericanum STM3625]